MKPKVIPSFWMPRTEDHMRTMLELLSAIACRKEVKGELYKRLFGYEQLPDRIIDVFRGMEQRNRARIIAKLKRSLAKCDRGEHLELVWVDDIVKPKKAEVEQ